MKIAIAIIAVFGVALTILGIFGMKADGSADQRLGAVVPCVMGAALLIADVLLALGYAVFR